MQQTDFLTSNEDSVCFYSAELNSSGIVSLFNEEELDECETDFIVSTRQLLFVDPNISTRKCIERKSDNDCRYFIFTLQSDLSPPGFV